MIKRDQVLLMAALVGFISPALAEQERFSVAGAANTQSSGVDNPYYLLDKPVIQELAFEARLGPLDKSYVKARLVGSGVSIDNLVATDILRPVSGNRYALAMNVVDVEDKKLIRAVADPAAKSLAEAILSRRDEFNGVLSKYDLVNVDQDLTLMALLGCVVLDWDGLGVTADEGYRRAPERKPDGSKYQITMQENAPGLSVRALYWGSHNEVTAGDAVVVTTFGDHEHLNRQGFPDFVSVINRQDIQNKGASEKLAKVTSAIYRQAMNKYQSISGRIMIALRAGPAGSNELAGKLDLQEAEIEQALRLLEALNYIEKDGDLYQARIPVFSINKDAVMLEEFRALGQEVMSDWLKDHYKPMRQSLSDLKSVKAGVPYEIVYTQLWHDVFGWTNYHLAQAGYLYDAYGPNAEFVSFVPFVWEAPMMLFEGTKIF